MLSVGKARTGRNFVLPMLRLVCKWGDGFWVEETSIIISNLGLPDDFYKHMMKQHKLANPKEGEDYDKIEVLTST